jgi:hypothetical protein
MSAKKPAKPRRMHSRKPAAKPLAPAREPTAIATLARRHGEAALAALIEVVGDRTASPAARISAASALLNWGFAKSNPAAGEGGEGPAELVIRWLSAEEAQGMAPKAKSKP